jgi:hypothetical protein
MLFNISPSHHRLEAEVRRHLDQARREPAVNCHGLAPSQPQTPAGGFIFQYLDPAAGSSSARCIDLAMIRPVLQGRPSYCARHGVELRTSDQLCT